MYCPKCGQLVPDTTRFCSRCGIPLSEVSEWLAGSGWLASRAAPPQNLLSSRRKSMRFGAKMMFWGAIVFPVFLALSIAVDGPAPLFIPFLVFLAGLSILLYSRLFGEEIPADRSAPPQDLSFGSKPGYGALPPGSEAEVIVGGRRQRTAEMVPPPSVTEQTTKFLDSE